jgi:hypothetical protein
MRFMQPIGTRGSLKWIQRAVNDRCEVIDTLILSSIPGATHIEWLSPLLADEFAEYRDDTFLKCIGHVDLAHALAAFWPPRGPQWDALGRTDTDEVILVEAKAHIDEMFSSGSQASQESLTQITDALDQTISAFWCKPAYQLGRPTLSNGKSTRPPAFSHHARRSDPPCFCMLCWGQGGERP